MNPPTSGPQFWHAVFGNQQPVEVEIGPGTGTFILSAAAMSPNINFFGIEHSSGRAATLAKLLAQRGLRNVRVLAADAACVVSTVIPSASVSAYHIYFPDPWWKRRHFRRRLFTPSFAAALERTIVSGGQIYLATDVDAVCELALRLLGQCPALARDESLRSPRTGRTVFEHKGLRRGAHISEITFVKRPAPRH